MEALTPNLVHFGERKYLVYFNGIVVGYKWAKSPCDVERQFSGGYKELLLVDCNSGAVKRYKRHRDISSAVALAVFLAVIAFTFILFT